MSVETFEAGIPLRPVASGFSPRSIINHFGKSWHSLTPRRVLRMLLGSAGAVVILLLIFNWLVVPAVWPKTSEAVVNAPITSQRVDSEGSIHIAHQVGDSVQSGEILASSANSYLNKGSVLRLKTDKANTEAELTRVTADLKTVKRLRDKARLELDKYRSSLATELTISLQQADAKIAELTAVRDEAARMAESNRALYVSGVIPHDDYYRAVEDRTVAQTRLDQSRAEKRGIDNQLESAKRDVFIQRDSPIHLTLYMQFQQDVAATEAKVTETKGRLLSVTRELAQAESFENRLAGGEVVSPIAGVIWRVNTSSGPLAKGESLFEIADTQRAFVEAQFQESFSSSLYPGARVVISASGSPSISGKVRALRQTSPTEMDNAYAIRLPRRLNQVKVYIDVDQPALIASMVGRQCRVLVVDPNARLFSKQAFDWLALKFFALLGW